MILSWTKTKLYSSISMLISDSEVKKIKDEFPYERPSVLVDKLSDQISPKLKEALEEIIMEVLRK